ncbi:MAG: ATP-binding protein [Candidatus Nanopelagicales bacterium]|nr:ATP-binding protein [Candidatus Nanopelagicales bacterium]
MRRSSQTVEILPSPRRLTEVLRDVGYDFVSAVADVVDNSIAAKASRIEIDVSWAGPDSWIRIADNGFGMDAATINEALRFGSERSYRADDLGKFGLGLKTASLSQCRQILVASRVSPNTARIDARSFDLDRIIRDDEWTIEIVAAAHRPSELTAPLRDGPGTVVMWKVLDRLLGFKVPRGQNAHNALLEMTERLEQHLAMVFHRFLEGDVSGRHGRKLTMTLNGNRIAPWNPFALDEPSTQHLQTREFDISANGVQGLVTFDPWILPTREQFSSEAAFNRMSGPSKWNHQQGFYIYRANRMIQSGGWSRIRAADEHTKYARIALDFFPELDPAFGINIAKMRVQLPQALRERMKDPLQDAIRVANKSYRAESSSSRGGSKAGKEKAATTPLAPKPKPKPIAEPQPNQPGGSTNPLGPAPIAWPPAPLARRPDVREAIETAAADVGEVGALERIVAHLRSEFPEVARDLGW